MAAVPTPKPTKAAMPSPTPAANAAVRQLAEALSAVIREAVFDAFVELHAEDQSRPPPVLLDRAGLAEALHTSPATVSRLVTEGMPRIMLLDSPRYRLADVLAWLEQRTRERGQ